MGAWNREESGRTLPSTPRWLLVSCNDVPILSPLRGPQKPPLLQEEVHNTLVKRSSTPPPPPASLPHWLSPFSPGHRTSNGARGGTNPRLWPPRPLSQTLPCVVGTGLRNPGWYRNRPHCGLSRKLETSHIVSTQLTFIGLRTKNRKMPLKNVAAL